MSIAHFDVIVVGAGISGIGAGYFLQKNCPTKTYTILEGRDNIGGTWDLFKYPGVRSDSDMYTLGFSFSPWTNGKAIADGADILKYIKDTACKNNIEKNIRFKHQVESANWLNEKSLWTISSTKKDSGETVLYTCNFLYMCCGYYRYDEGYTPEFAGRENFKGQIIHPQHWPENFNYKNKNIVVIGSGATAVTLIPNMTDDAKHVTMLQRSPTYIVGVPNKDFFASGMRKIFPKQLAYDIVRLRNVSLFMAFYQFCIRFPKASKKVLLAQTRLWLRKNADISHFKPSYNPWEQRLCLAPDGDFFLAIKKGTASVVTDQIKHFDATGIQLASGKHLAADIIITATGLNLIPFGGLKISVDGKPFDISKCMTYKGMMIQNLPNFAYAIGYTNASWTLKADLTSAYVTRVLRYMDAHQYKSFTPSNVAPDVAEAPFMDLASGYIQRAAGQFPKQGSKAPWKLYQNYFLDLMSLRFSKVDDEVMTFK